MQLDAGAAAALHEGEVKVQAPGLVGVEGAGQSVPGLAHQALGARQILPPHEPVQVLHRPQTRTVVERREEGRALEGDGPDAAGAEHLREPPGLAEETEVLDLGFAVLFTQRLGEK